MSSQPPAPRRSSRGTAPKEANPGLLPRAHSQSQARQVKDDSVLERTKSMPPQGRRASHEGDVEGLKAWSPEPKKPGQHRGMGTKYAQLVALQDKKKGQQHSKSLANAKERGDKRAEGGARSQRPDPSTDSALGLKATGSKCSAGGLATHPVDASSDGGSEEMLEDEVHQKPASILGGSSMLPSGMSGAFNKTMQALASAAHHVYPWQPFSSGQFSSLFRIQGSDSSTGDLSTRVPLASDVDSLEGLLMWRNAWKSAKAFVGGLYLLICIKVYLDSGIQILQPTTVFAGLALCILIYNSLARSAPLQGSQAVLEHDPHGETMLLHRVSSGIYTVGSVAAVALPPFVALSSRHLSAPRGPPKFYLAVCLWLVMLVGELKLLFQTSLMLVIWIGLFTLPRLYAENKWLLDGLARAGFAVLIAALRRRHRATLLMAVAGGLTVFWALEITFVVRCTMAMAISGATLFWRVSKSNVK